MKRTLLVALLALFSAGAHAMLATTNSGYVACLTEQCLMEAHGDDV